MGRKGLGHSKARQDLQVLGHCIWKAWAPTHSPKTHIWTKATFHSEPVAVEMQLNAVVCPVLVQYLSGTSVQCVLAAGRQRCQTAARAQPLLAGPTQEKLPLPLYIQSHFWIPLVLWRHSAETDLPAMTSSIVVSCRQSSEAGHQVGTNNTEETMSQD